MEGRSRLRGPLDACLDRACRLSASFCHCLPFVCCFPPAGRIRLSNLPRSRRRLNTSQTVLAMEVCGWWIAIMVGGCSSAARSTSCGREITH